MNIIFLDIDGVLNSIRKLKSVYDETGRPHSNYDYPFDEVCLENLQLLVKITNSKLVITSTWRKDSEGIRILLNTLKKYGLDKEVIGYTSILDGKREVEIEHFLSKFHHRPNFIVLDDDSNLGNLTPWLIKTDTQVGLTNENVCDAIKKLKKL